MGTSRSTLYNNMKNKLQEACNERGYNMVLDFNNNAIIQDKQAILLPTSESHSNSTMNTTRFKMTYEVRVIRFLRNESSLLDLFTFIDTFITKLDDISTMINEHKVEYTYGNFATSNELTIIAKIIIEVE